MALGALDARSHKDLRNILGKLFSFQLNLEEVRRRRGEGAAFRHQQLADDFVEWRVCCYFCPQPVMVKQGGLVADLILEGADLEELGPFHHPDFGKVLGLDKLINDGFSFLWVGVF